MKISIIALSLLLPTVTYAQEMPNMNQMDMTNMSQVDIMNMMKNLQGMETCMQNIDENNMNALKIKAKQIEAEVDALCSAGKRSQAQDKAISYGKKMASDPTMQAMMKCIEPMKGMMKSVPMMPFDEAMENSDIYVCD